MTNKQDFLNEQFRKLAEALHEISSIYKLNGRWQEVKKLVDFGLSINLEKTYQAKLQVILAEILIKQADFTRGEALLNSAEEIAKAINDKKILGSVLYWRGEICYIKKFMMDIGEYQTSTDLHEQALAIREEIKDLRGVTESLSRIGVIHERQKDFETAKSLYLRAVKIAKEIDYPLGSERAITHLAVHSEMAGDMDKALEYHQRALQICEEEGDLESKAFSLINNGKILFKINGDSQQYLEKLKEALKISEHLDFKIAIGISLYRFGELYSELADKTNAKKYFQKMIEFAEAINFKALVKFASDQMQNLEDAKQ